MFALEAVPRDDVELEGTSLLGSGRFSPAR
jgi:hypothetical protein